MNVNNNPLLSFLGLCRRAGKMTIGNDVVIDSMKNKESNLVLLAKDLSARTEKGILLAAEKYNVEIKKLTATKEELGFALGKYAAVISINDQGFGKKIRTLTAQVNEGEECNL